MSESYKNSENAYLYINFKIFIRNFVKTLAFFGKIMYNIRDIYVSSQGGCFPK